LIVRVLRRFLADVLPPVVSRHAGKAWRRTHGLGWHNFYGQWPTLADVPVTEEKSGNDPWAQTIVAGWRENIKASGAQGQDDLRNLILPLLASGFAGPLTVLDFGGGSGIGLANILKFARMDLSRLSYVLVETPAMCRIIRSEIETHSGKVVEQIPDTLEKPLIVNAGSALQYVSDYKSALARLARLGPDIFIVSETPMSDHPTYACQILNTPHRKMATWVFNRAELVDELKKLGFSLSFAVARTPQLTHKKGPGPFAISNMVFRPTPRPSSTAAN
jgi:putative methyltransferase (TIGR04325 family)